MSGTEVRKTTDSEKICSVKGGMTSDKIDKGGYFTNRQELQTCEILRRSRMN
uniref:Uncharacterized protein n=1 Tax=Leclercia adecarboxylata TaxID=83655 RepID=A0A482M1I8_9ENTR|nr:Hypothetical protein [Leclercia adecarboxylata]